MKTTERITLLLACVWLLCAAVVISGAAVEFYGTGMQVGGVYVDWYYVTHKGP